VNNTGSSESRGLWGGGGVKDDSVESSYRWCALMIGLEWILESRLGHSQLRILCPRLPPLLIVQRDGVHNHGSVGTQSRSVERPLRSIQQEYHGEARIMTSMKQFGMQTPEVSIILLFKECKLKLALALSFHHKNFRSISSHIRLTKDYQNVQFM
jgi:hypothetical protein